MASALDKYRSLASFNWRELKNVVEGEEHVKTKEKIYELLSKEPIFKRGYDRPSLEQQRELNHRRWKRIIELELPVDPYADTEGMQCLGEVLEAYDQGLSARIGLHASVFGMAVASMCTKRHEAILEQIRRNEIVGCFCLTELGHGSNTQEIQTTATFDNGEFVFNCPSDEAVKCWAGNLSQSATHAVVFAQLYVGGKCEGVHAFVLQVRDPKTYETLPGITIGDMGEKPGAWNGVENGWMEFKNHRAPLWTLLNKGCGVTATGKYVSNYKSASERQSVSLGALSVGRVGIIGKGVMAAGLASTIAIRYSACRRQFGKTKGDEIPVIEYPLQQHRLFPYLAGYFAIRLFHRRFTEHFTEYITRMIQGEKSDQLAEFSKEIHALSSAVKPVSTWFGVEALSEARKACGGHGFLHSSRLNELRDSFDPSQTFEGENYMILQQASNILLNKLATRTPTPMKSFDFLYETPKLFSGFTEDIVKDVIKAYNWLILYLIKQTSADFDCELKSGNDCTFCARNQVQVHRAQCLSIAYAELTIIDWSKQFVDNVQQKPIKDVLGRLIALYGLFSFEKHLATCYIGGYCTGAVFGEGIRSSIRKLESEIAPDAAALVDAIAPPDFVLNSALGNSDGRPYDHLMDEFRKHTDLRAAWQKDLSGFLEQNKRKESKL
ncbi:unnamed protein product [Nippostrongylus brasiliensis]|uniref:Acyl-coenzyme A oxidase n=1 Tax=Nippostrongylus brasiliensis TaxID=27835 RepID=A0A0N4YH24_NIPBR|nr:hypothetical protein Q1695_007726 [Nippostrongylus brasiliensis]VDL79733.1 unnamed protein product [Nippostrongylus brasiliensis]